jgi:hypothetical protein
MRYNSRLTPQSMTELYNRFRAAKIMNRRPIALALALILTLASGSAYAQDGSATAEGVSLAQTLSLLPQIAGSGPVGEALRFATALEVATTPYGTSSGAFVFKLDPTTGLEVRTASTFGPSFAERAITGGAGQVSVSVNLIAATYDKLGDFDLDQMELANSTSNVAELRQRGFTSLVLASESTVIQTVMGATDNLDIGILIPIVKVRLKGVSWVENDVRRTQADGTVGNDVLALVSAEGKSAGVGDVGVSAKYRFLRFGGTPPPDAPLEPDPGGLAVLANLRLPTGSRENLRGLGVTRAMLSLVASMGQRRFRPHVNAGFEWWDKGIDIRSAGDPTVTVRHQVQYAAGIEFEAAPKFTVLLDVLGRHTLGGGEIALTSTTDQSRIREPRVSAVNYAFATDQAIRKLSLVPGIKWNLKGKMLLSVSGITSLSDNGLHDLFTPVVGLDITF